MCGEFTSSDIGKTVTVMGFTAKYRNLGMILFVDLRDRTGIVQLSFSKEKQPEVFEKSTLIRNEYVLAAKGIVAPRGEKNINSNLKTGSIEILVVDLRIISEAQTPPFNICDDVKASELLRLKYRYLDLRRQSLQKNFIVRDQIIKAANDYLHKMGFLFLETPFLGKSTPEGARDYLVPSRLYTGKFYALPQSPQLYKQLFMIAGFDKYYQIVKCFRDEDLRANRQPEFTQIDVEMSFVDDISEVMNIAEGLISNIFRDTLSIKLPKHFRRIKYAEAMERFGSDKPDTRFSLELKDITQIVKNCGFSIFSEAAKTGSVRGINIEGRASMTRKEIDSFSDIAKDFGIKALTYIAIKEEGITSPISKFFDESSLKKITDAFNAKTGDIILIAAGKTQSVFDALGSVRLSIGKKYDLIDKSIYDILWVTHFPLFEYDEAEKRLYAKHHPFTSPLNEDLKYMEKKPLKVRAKAYDLVINGEEAGGGSIRIHSKEIQETMFKSLGFSESDIRERFGFFVDAFQYGVPPHGGFAFGLDRLVMLITGSDNIKDVVAFPKTQNALCLMTEAPSSIEEEQLRELSLKIQSIDPTLNLLS
jgi:aspartyl-tRNA synthetase